MKISKAIRAPVQPKAIYGLNGIRNVGGMRTKRLNKFNPLAGHHRLSDSPIPVFRRTLRWPVTTFAGRRVHPARIVERRPLQGRPQARALTSPKKPDVFDLPEIYRAPGLWGGDSKWACRCFRPKERTDSWGLGDHIRRREAKEEGRPFQWPPVFLPELPPVPEAERCAYCREWATPMEVEPVGWQLIPTTLVQQPPPQESFEHPVWYGVEPEPMDFEMEGHPAVQIEAMDLETLEQDGPCAPTTVELVIPSLVYWEEAPPSGFFLPFLPLSATPVEPEPSSPTRQSPPRCPSPSPSPSPPPPSPPPPPPRSPSPSPLPPPPPPTSSSLVGAVTLQQESSVDLRPADPEPSTRDEEVVAPSAKRRKESPTGPTPSTEPRAAPVAKPRKSAVNKVVVSLADVDERFSGFVEEAMEASGDVPKPLPKWWQDVLTEGDERGKGMLEYKIRSVTQYSTFPPQLVVEPQYHCPDPSRPEGEFNTRASCRLGGQRNTEEAKRFFGLKKNHPEVWCALIGTMLQEGVSMDNLLLCHEIKDDEDNIIDLKPEVLQGQKWVQDNWRFDQLAWSSVQEKPLPPTCSKEFHVAPKGEERVYNETLKHLKDHPEIAYLFRTLLSLWLKVEMNQEIFRDIARKAGWVPESEIKDKREYVKWVLEEAPIDIYNLCSVHLGERYYRFFNTTCAEYDIGTI